MEGYLVLLIFEDNIDQDFSVWHQATKMPMKCFVSCKEWHMPIKSTTPSLRQHFQQSFFFKKSAQSIFHEQSAGAEGGCVESQTGFGAAEKVNALFYFQSKLKSAQEQKGKNKLSANRKEKKNSFTRKKGAISCDWRRGQMGCGSAEWRIDAEHEAEATDGLRSMQRKKRKKSHARQTETSWYKSNQSHFPPICALLVTFVTILNTSKLIDVLERL